MKYKIQYRIETLAENAVGAIDAHPSFVIDGIAFTQWDFNHRDGWISDAWLAETEIEASDYKIAHKIFVDKLALVVPRVAFVSQCYTETLGQPFLIVKSNSDIGLFADFFDSGHVGLMFMENQKSALDKLLRSPIDNAFFYYWNDAVNTIGYAPKLLVMFSAIEALAKKSNGKKDWTLIENILGKDLANEIFEPKKGLRHRLIHGEYFSQQDFHPKDYVGIIHQQVMSYFNKYILGSNLLSENVINPQRHFFGNKMFSYYFIKPKDNSAHLTLKEVLADFNSSKDRRPTSFEHVYDKDLTANY